MICKIDKKEQFLPIFSIKLEANKKIESTK